MHTVSSVIFGFIYISLWISLGQEHSLEHYSMSQMITYIAFNQASVWVLFFTNGLGIESAVRTGDIAVILARPIHMFQYYASREWGQIGYQVLFQALPTFGVYVVSLPLRYPTSLTTPLITAASLLLAAYIMICINFLIGITALWTTETRWIFWLHYSLSILLSGFMIPVEWLPGWLRTVANLSPYPATTYYPARFFLEMEPVSSLWIPGVWALLLTAACFLVTNTARRKVEVQGG
jgi:ABC-2 type transport system permease protein